METRSERDRRAGRALHVVAILLGIAALVAGAAVLLIDKIAASAVESGGTYALGVPTKLDSADIGVVSGRVELDQLAVANPPGFHTPRFFGLAHAAFQLPPKQLLEDEVVIDEITLEGIDIALERADGKTNYGTLLDHLKHVSPEAKEAKGEQEKAGKTFVIKKLVLRDIRATIDLVPPLPSQSVTLSGIELHDVGTGGDGLEMAELFARVITEVLSQVVASAGNLIPADLKGQLQKSLDAFSDDALHQMTKGFGKAGHGIQEGAKDVGKGIKKLFD